MMPQSTADGVILPSMRNRLDKLGYDRPQRRFLDVFSIRPPSEIIRFFDSTVRTSKQRDIIFHPCRRIFIVNLVDNSFVILTVKLVDIHIELSVQVFLARECTRQEEQ